MQIATQPILVNGANINTGLYPVLNYKPAGAQYPYIYVLIAEFSKVGAKVNWDDVMQILSVSTDYYTNLSAMEDLKRRVAALEGTMPANASLIVTSIDGDLTEAQKMEAFGLAGTKSLEELNRLFAQGSNEAYEAAVLRGGELGGGGGLDGDAQGFNIVYGKSANVMANVYVLIHTNDPELDQNYNKYTDEQKEFFYKQSMATSYVAYKAIRDKILTF